MTDIFKKLISFLLVEYALKYTIPNKLGDSIIIYIKHELPMLDSPIFLMLYYAIELLLLYFLVDCFYCSSL